MHFPPSIPHTDVQNPRASSSSFNWPIAFSLRDNRPNAYPSFASRTAMALPMPRLQPETMQTPDIVKSVLNNKQKPSLL